MHTLYMMREYAYILYILSGIFDTLKMGCKRKLGNITFTYSLKTVRDPHWAGKQVMDSPHEAAVD